MRVSIERIELKDVARKTLSIAEKHKFPAILLRKYSISPAPTKNIMLNIGTVPYAKNNSCGCRSSLEYNKF